MPVISGMRLGPYEVLELTGAGGAGKVYRSRDSRLDRVVAIKGCAGRSRLIKLKTEPVNS
jgi:hypothetical protein